MNDDEKIKRIVGISYEEYSKLNIDEKHKLIEQKTGKKVKPDHRLNIDGIPMDDEHIIKMNEVDNYLTNLTKKVKRKSKNIFKKY
ncbi:MAG: hypothetical protein IJO32_07325 [Bacilli bacterium]|nr:hypothetical protein [Bacilli bacterium]